MYNPKLIKICYFLLLVIVIGFNIHLRLIPAHFPQLKTQSLIKVERNIVQKARDQVEKTYPEYTSLAKKRIVKEIAKKHKKDKRKFKAEVEKEYQRAKSRYQDQNGQTYLLEVDPYCWMRFTRLILENGYPGNKKDEKGIYDTFMLAPEGRTTPYNRFLFYFSAYLYKAVFLIFPGITLKGFLFYLPVFFSIIFFIVLYLFCRYFFSEMAGILAVFFTGLSRIFIVRSSAGWFDTDILNILFPLLVIWSLLAATKQKKILLNILLSLLASLFLALFSFTWNGWWLVYLVAGGFFIYVLLNNFSLYYRDLNTFKRIAFPYIISLFTFFLGSSFFCLLIAGIEPFSFTYRAILANLGLGKSTFVSIWPNTYYTVGEFQKGGFSHMPSLIWGWLPFFLAIVSTLVIYVKERRSQKSDIVTLLVFWTFCAFFISLKGQRFALFLTLSLGIFLAVGLNEALEFIYVRVKNIKNIKIKGGILTLMIIALYFIFFPIVTNASTRAKTQFPFMNDALYNFLVTLRKDTPQNCIINSWWDYGNWFKEISRRRVIFDPQSQNNSLAYWMAKVLITDDEDKALRILRMMNNSSDKLFAEITKHTGDEFKSVVILEEFLASDLKAADRISQKYGLPKELAQRVKNIIFLKNPAPAYYIIDRTLMQKIHAISFLGNWDFRKVFINKHKQMPKDSLIKDLRKIFPLSPSEAGKIYNEVVSSASAKEGNEVVSRRWTFNINLRRGKEKNGLVYFNNGVILNLDNMEAAIFSYGGYKRFKYVLFFDGKKLVSKENKNPDFKGSVLIIKSKEKDKFIWECVGLSSEALGDSIYSKLYFMKAKGLKYFEPFVLDDKSGFYAFKIKWPKADNQNR